MDNRELDKQCKCGVKDCKGECVALDEMAVYGNDCPNGTCE